MKKLVFGALLLVVSTSATSFPGLDVLKPFSTPEKQQQAVSDLIGRVFGQAYQSQFSLVVDPTLVGDSDVVIIDRGPQETIKITAGSGPAVAWGVNHFLRNCCNVHVSWDGNQIKLPPSLPHPAVRAQHNSIGRFRYYSNVCTYSYSFVWWDWAQWEQHLDWLALNGVNLPLASVAMEAIWQRVYTKMGLSQADIDAFFTGPAFLAWRRMGNLKGWAGPLSANYHKNQVDLQHKILARMVDFGMVPVLPTFAGHVPDAVQKLYPNASIATLQWLTFNCSYSCVRFVDPTDPLFQKIGSMFMTEMKNEFGLYHAYSADPFNEMAAKSYDKDYLDAVGKAIYHSMTAEDPDAVWVMQAWMFVGDGRWQVNDAGKALLLSVPIGKLLLLDLYSEQMPVYQKFESFYGQPFIWNVLHNFGGVQGLFGAVSKINDNLYTASKDSQTTLVGVGLTMEGIYQNYPIYQFSWDRAWSARGQKLNQSIWITHFARQRYGIYDDYLNQGWQALWANVYDQASTPSYFMSRQGANGKGNNLRGEHVSPLTDRPNLNMNTDPGYDPKSLCSAWKFFIYRAPFFQNSSLFRLDLVDITREGLLMIAGSKYRLLVKAYLKKDLDSLTNYGIQLVQLLDDTERILATHEHFLLGRWIQQARALGVTNDEKDQFEYNMRNQLTLWGPNGEILDYARKEWAGLMSDYYKPRWFLFVNMLAESLLPSGPTFLQSRYDSLVFTMVEQPFTFKKSTYPDEPIGDSVQVATEFYNKYANDCPIAA